MGLYDSWAFKRTLSLDTTSSGADVGDTQSDFPVLLRIRSSEMDFSQAETDLKDGRITNFAETVDLDFEIDRWDSGASLGEIWVRVPTVNGNSNTDKFKMHWGKSGQITKSNPNNTFRTADDFAGVWHLTQDPDGDVADAIKDSTGNNNDGTPDGNMTSADLVEGVIGKALDFDGSTTVNEADTIITADIDYGSGDKITVSAWFKTSETFQPGNSSMGYIFSKRKFTGANPYVLFVPSSNKLTASVNDTSVVSSSTVNDGNWHLGVLRFDGTTLTLFLDGVLIGTATPTAVSNNNKFAIGSNDDDPEYRPFKGQIDETRIVQLDLSDDWLKLEFESQQPVPTLVTFGDVIGGTTFSARSYPRGINRGTTRGVI